jgi:hypothetical protein
MAIRWHITCWSARPNIILIPHDPCDPIDRHNANVAEKRGRERSAVHALQFRRHCNVSLNQLGRHLHAGSVLFAHGDLLATLWQSGVLAD